MNQTAELTLNDMDPASAEEALLADIAYSKAMLADCARRPERIHHRTTSTDALRKRLQAAEQRLRRLRGKT